jgi:hypothetical protein
MLYRLKRAVSRLRHRLLQWRRRRRNRSRDSNIYPLW